MESAALERELCRIPGVTATRVVVGAGGVPAEIHILATPDKPAKQVVRDVLSVAAASFDVELDRRIVSVVQLDAPAEPAPAVTDAVAPAANGSATGESIPAGEASGRAPGQSPPGPPEEGPERAPGQAPLRPEPARPAPRVSLGGVSIAQDGASGTVEVTLGYRGAKAVGWESGSASVASIRRQVARATLAALRQFNPAVERLEVETVTVTRLGDREVAAATLTLLDPPREEVFAGMAVVGVMGTADALARAVLDAVNRRLGGLERPGV